MEGLDEIIKEFLVESYESLDQLDSDLLALEEAPEDLDRIASIFRNVHTIKGTSGFLALPKLEKVAHVGENLLVPLRDGELKLNAPIADGLLGMVDAIRQMLVEIEKSGGEGSTDYGDLVERLQSLRESESSAEESEDAGDPGDPDTSSPENSALDPKSEPGERSEENPAPSHGEEEAPKSLAPESEAEMERAATPSVADATVRIDVELLDKLMNLVGELVLSRNQILQFCNSTDDPSMIAASQRLNLITTELQEGVMKTRMQPIRNAWSKLPRVVRDLSLSCGKNVEVRMEGADTELDKTILEAIKDPLTHIVRNSVDHGIETPEDRIAAGKTAEGSLTLRAFHEGGQVNIEITDDGGGINAERVRDKAIEKGLITAEQANELNERELTSLILLPGFSTAAKVTNVSGRGVGMDVVKTNIERIGGTLDIQSQAGTGTTLRIKIPLTLAIVPALVVKTGGDRYAIPQVSLLELVRLDSNRVKDAIEFIHDVPVYRLRENLLPLIYLDEQLELREPRGRRDHRDRINIVVLQAEDRQFGLVVDAITDTQEIVVKPLGQDLKSIPAYAGATIMGDGTVALILDVIGIAQKSGVLTEHRDRSLREDSSHGFECGAETESLLIVDSDDQTRAAIRLSTVSRLEEFVQADVERCGDSHVVQYRGEIMPLIPLTGYGAHLGGDWERLNTVVFSSGDQSIGIVVGKIVDIVHEKVGDHAGQQSPKRVINDRVTTLVDLEELVSQRLPELSRHFA